MLYTCCSGTNSVYMGRQALPSQITFRGRYAVAASVIVETLLIINLVFNNNLLSKTSVSEAVTCSSCSCSIADFFRLYFRNF